MPKDRTMAYDIEGESVRVSAATAAKWARAVRIKLPEAGKLEVINKARIREGLPVFEIIGERPPARPAPKSAPPADPVPGSVLSAPILPPYGPPKIPKAEPIPRLETAPMPPTTFDCPAAPQETAPEAHDAILRTSAGLREVLFQELESVRAGKSDPKRAMAVAKLAQTVVDSVRMELEFARLPPSKDTGMPVPLVLVRS